MLGLCGSGCCFWGKKPNAHQRRKGTVVRVILSRAGEVPRWIESTAIRAAAAGGGRPRMPGPQALVAGYLALQVDSN